MRQRSSSGLSPPTICSDHRVGCRRTTYTSSVVNDQRGVVRHVEAVGERIRLGLVMYEREGRKRGLWKLESGRTVRSVELVRMSK
jgi:hypothetical protein